jgi:hypothetical protein
LYAVLIKEFALALYEYTQVFQSLKSDLKNAEINQLIVGRVAAHNLINKLSVQEQNNFFDLFGVDDSYALEAKSILKKDGTLRTVKDFFGSVILKVIDVPDTSSEILGKFIYYLCEDNTGAYSRLEQLCLSHLPFIVRGSNIGAFANSVLRFLWNYDKLLKLKDSIKSNSKEEANQTIVTDLGRLTSIFRTSSTYLSEAELSSGDKLRFFIDPIFTEDQKLYYLSTEWSFRKDSRLDLETFKNIIELKYLEFKINFEPDSFTLISVSTPHSIRRKKEGVSQAIPKPFLLLAGISGTGKSRFVINQALMQCDDALNYLPVAVRPDWHEPSDLLGYVTRIGGERYQCSPFLKFIVQAWIESIESVSLDAIELRPLSEIVTYWVCLDEMNLAPVEQYFADYLSVIESRKWDGQKYTCDPLINPRKLSLSSNSLDLLRSDLGLDSYEAIWQYFLKNGISIPPNLIVAGTVNMDETTHGFSRKVIDRAFTLDFGEFFPNKFSSYFVPEFKFKTLTFPHYSSVSENDLANVMADPTGGRSIEFLFEINQILSATPFEIAYRALNELLVALVCISPKDHNEISAVWDDFLMTKILPRIESDKEKLHSKGDRSLLTDLSEQINKSLKFSSNQVSRPDLLRVKSTGEVFDVEFRSLKKITWMQQRLDEHSFTSFWP